MRPQAGNIQCLRSGVKYSISTRDLGKAMKPTAQATVMGNSGVHGS